MKRSRLVAAVVACAALAAVAWWALQASPRPVELARVTRGPLVERFEEEGRTRLPRRWVLSAPMAGTVQRIDTLPGTPVHVGDVLAVIEPLPAALIDPANRVRLEAEAKAAVAARQAATQRLAAARADATLAQRDVARMRTLGASGVVSVAALDEAEARLERARAMAAAAEAEQQAATQQHAALLALLQRQGHAGGQAITLRSPIDGVLLRRHQESAATVAAGQPLLEVGDLRTLQVMVQALSQQALRLHPGTPAQILRWGGDTPLDARVDRVEPGAFTKISALGVEEQRTEVWLDITTPPAQWKALGDDFRVEVQFEVTRHPDVLQVASSALFRDGRRWAAYRVDGGRAHLVAVTPGIEGDGAVQIVDGLREGDRVVAYPDDRLADGQRVRVVAP